MAFSLTVKEAAELLNISIGRVHQLIQAGTLEAQRIGNQWLIDDESVDQRSSLKLRAGRPTFRDSTNEDSEQFVLMNRNHEVLSFTCSSKSHIFMTIDEIRDHKRAPLGIVSPRGAKASTAALNNWWKHRAIPVTRANIANKLSELGLLSETDIPFASFGLSLSDQYWIKPHKSQLRWDDINYFNNDFPDMNVRPSDSSLNWLSAVGLKSPDNTSDGNLPKKWIRYKKSPMLVKGGGPLNQEPYNEAAACALYKRLLKPEEFIDYELVESDTGRRGEAAKSKTEGSIVTPDASVDEGIAVCVCRDFIAEDEEYIPAYYVLKTKRKPNHFSEHQHYVDCSVNLGVLDIEATLAKMLVCDDILANFDRHWRNFGLVRNVETLEYRAAPIFDSGSCLWCDKPAQNLLNGDFSFETKPFYEKPKRQLRLVQDYSWLNIDALDGFVDEAHEILSGNRSIQDRLDAICTGIQLRIKHLKRIAY